ncbi:aminoacyl-tRNA hydrolase [Candidatus Campbellbacteria bacterium CG10_big_fil_rev_8_21_14_0_10_35_52]|uniref:Aminoacyl-tRNA hydrolase n=1 Tax=Candidatus Campbellbacteria bacterium CG10_big_fil_rev_8_21_14_0_10_35_52 TaxID=1974527 RepID=A0A2M6WVC7_9BACT|nr:MAG: aminoacyl-tRNA hydrolase [Candidatus Campbellbacteria bacterium CG10_big_fil_rev_8_21_14_0_10_35_52]
MFYIIGLGNPGEEYKNSRHNTGVLSVLHFAKKNDMKIFNADKKIRAIVSIGKIGKEKIMLILPQTFMNKSGLSAGVIVTSRKKAENLIVVYDDLDMPLGKFKISFGRGSGGHKGVESVARAVKTKDFIRVRVGIAPSTPSGKIKKPKGEKDIKKKLIYLKRFLRILQRRLSSL